MVFQDIICTFDVLLTLKLIDMKTTLNVVKIGLRAVKNLVNGFTDIELENLKKIKEFKDLKRAGKSIVIKE